MDGQGFRPGMRKECKYEFNVAVRAKGLLAFRGHQQYRVSWHFRAAKLSKPLAILRKLIGRKLLLKQQVNLSPGPMLANNSALFIFARSTAPMLGVGGCPMTAPEGAVSGNHQ